MGSVTPFPRSRNAGDPLERDLREVAAAIGLVASGAAVRVLLVCLADPASVAPAGIALAQIAGVAFAVERTRAARQTIVVGPRA